MATVGEPQHLARVDGTLAECDRVGDGRADYSGKHRRHGVNLQVITHPRGEIVWISHTLPGRTHDLTAARPHRIVATFATPTRRPPARSSPSGKDRETGRTPGCGIRSRGMATLNAGVTSVTPAAAISRHLRAALVGCGRCTCEASEPRCLRYSASLVPQ
ncbi:transposase family protein [Actinacidiphila glaucinigra]